MALLINRIGKDVLKKRLQEETFNRKTVSFYRYVTIQDPAQKRDELYKMWSDLNCFGRIYVAHEGINAQMNVPEHNWDAVSYTHLDVYKRQMKFLLSKP